MHTRLDSTREERSQRQAIGPLHNPTSPAPSSHPTPAAQYPPRNDVLEESQRVHSTCHPNLLLIEQQQQQRVLVEQDLSAAQSRILEFIGYDTFMTLRSILLTQQLEYRCQLHIYQWLVLQHSILDLELSSSGSHDVSCRDNKHICGFSSSGHNNAIWSQNVLSNKQASQVTNFATNDHSESGNASDKPGSGPSSGCNGDGASSVGIESEQPPVLTPSHREPMQSQNVAAGAPARESHVVSGLAAGLCDSGSVAGTAPTNRSVYRRVGISPRPSQQDLECMPVSTPDPSGLASLETPPQGIDNSAKATKSASSPGPLLPFLCSSTAIRPAWLKFPIPEASNSEVLQTPQSCSSERPEKLKQEQLTATTPSPPAWAGPVIPGTAVNPIQASPPLFQPPQAHQAPHLSALPIPGKAEKCALYVNGQSQSHAQALQPPFRPFGLHPAASGPISRPDGLQSFGSGDRQSSSRAVSNVLRPVDDCSNPHVPDLLPNILKCDDRICGITGLPTAPSNNSAPANSAGASKGESAPEHPLTSAPEWGLDEDLCAWLQSQLPEPWHPDIPTRTGDKNRKARSWGVEQLIALLANPEMLRLGHSFRHATLCNIAHIDMLRKQQLCQEEPGAENAAATGQPRAESQPRVSPVAPWRTAASAAASAAAVDGEHGAGEDMKEDEDEMQTSGTNDTRPVVNVDADTECSASPRANRNFCVWGQGVSPIQPTEAREGEGETLERNGEH